MSILTANMSTKDVLDGLGSGGKGEAFPRRKAMRRLQSSYNDEVNKLLSEMASNYQSLLEAAALPGDSTARAHDAETFHISAALRVKTHTEALVRAGRELLLLIAALKRDRCLAQSAAMNAAVDAARSSAANATQDASDSLDELASRVDELLASLETEYYVSME
ncbi:uncharacterized protein AMSG_06227 [Thecamonas trahens ATCC 50062]|uniref:Mediator of RNA polymerase II transcription subunit 22 n=1 Tax=Thecamonas trahens ATCC 50062 TaxID=461836 RepID=A0A0L0DC56_THETB|nr:hypothetical protein AMSG_06227 [Thecamonas trahens ATCC 50062]KNC49922.1 hypothetical protein AMSG_06227 [Thecamonas trahens ATCC 50062]|eukprot:XP_013757401.1 hypothetical protein AMSG_06227 [Thecamonas trahens ATCC 50062]